jgi:hypothetical protein
MSPFTNKAWCFSFSHAADLRCMGRSGSIRTLRDMRGIKSVLDLRRSGEPLGAAINGRRTGRLIGPRIANANSDLVPVPGCHR